MTNLRTIGKHLPRRRYSAGSLIKVGKKTKKWLGYWFVYVDNVRRKRRKILGPATLPKQEARELLRRHIAASRGVTDAAAPDLTVAELWDRYVEYKAASWGKHMRNMMESVFSSLVLPVLGRLAVADLTIDPLQRLVNQLAKDGRSAHTLRRIRVHLKAMLEYAVDIDLLSRNPARGKKLVVPKWAAKSALRVLSLDEIHKLLTNAEGRDHLILRLALVGGFRPAELFALRVGDVEPGKIMVDEALKDYAMSSMELGEPKTDGSTDYVAISKGLAKELKQWIAQLADRRPEAWLFPNATGTPFRPPNYLKRYLQPLAARLGVKGLTFRRMRTACATYFRQDLKSAQAQLRHASPMMTAKHYQRSIPAEQRAAVEALDQEFTAPKAARTESQVSLRSAKGAA